MAHSQKQAQLPSHHDTLREEVNLLLSEGQRDLAIQQYQAKSACSLDLAINFVNSVTEERSQLFRKRLVDKAYGGKLMFAMT